MPACFGKTLPVGLSLAAAGFFIVGIPEEAKKKNLIGLVET